MSSLKVTARNGNLINWRGKQRMTRSHVILNSLCSALMTIITRMILQVDKTARAGLVNISRDSKVIGHG